MPAKQDKYANVLYDTVEESAANTLTFEEVNVGLNMFDKVGLLVNRLEYSAFNQLLTADGDSMEFGLSASNGWTTADPGEDSVIDYNKFKVVDHGTAGNAIIWQIPYVKDFSNMPGGGILITPKPLYLFVDGDGLGNPGTVKLRMYFTIIKLAPQEYFELLEARQFFG